MDDRRFDAWTRELAVAKSRRRLLKGLGGAALGSLGIVAAAKAGSAQEAAGGDDDDRCNRPGERRCYRRCRRRGGTRANCRDRCCDD